MNSNINSELVDLSDFDYSKGIEIKANHKANGNKLIKSEEYGEAEDFYKKLITNLYFLNDYYPFRKLVEVYINKSEPGNVINTIEEFFKSERYCSGSQLLWFKFKYRKACKKIGYSFSKFDDCLDYYNEHGLKNKYKQNEPVPIAARIKPGRRKVKIISQEAYDKKTEYTELRLTYKYADKYESSEKALQYYEQLWDRREFQRDMRAYEKLCSLYYDTQQYEKAIKVAEEYFNSDLRKSKSGISRFDKIIDKSNKKLGKTPIQKNHQNHVNTNSMSKDDSIEPNISSNFNRNHIDIPIITVSRDNFTKLLSSEIGDEITIKRGKNSIKLEIIMIKNPKQIFTELHGDVKINISKENYNVVENILIGGVISIKHKNHRGQIDLKKVAGDVRKNPKEKVREKVFTDFVLKYVSHFESTPKVYLNDEHLRLMNLATECIENNELYRAVDYYDEILNQYPNFEILNKKGCLLIQLGEFEMAINCFDKSLECQKKNNFYAHVGKSLAISNLLKLYECNADQIDWDNKFESMMNHCHVACLIDNKGYIFKAKILNALGQYNGAIEVIDEILIKETLESKLYYSALLEKSLSFRQLGKYYQAIGCYDELLKIDENNVNILLNKAELLFILKNYDDSITAFNLVLQLDPENINALMYLGLIYQNFYNFDEALANFDRILEIDDSFYNALIYKAKLLVDLHRYDEAINCFNKCGDNLSNDYQKLFKFAKEEALQNNQTDYYAVTKTDFANFQYVYTYIDNGLRKIYGEDLADLKIKVVGKSRLWMNINKQNFLEIPISNENPDFVKKYIQNYYNDEFSEYEGLISLILSNDVLEKLDQSNLDLNGILNSKNGIEKSIVVDLVHTMKDKLNFVHNQNLTGYFGVVTQNKSDGTRWSYWDLVKKEYVRTKIIYAKTLDELEEKVKLENSLWYIFDEVLAKESQKRDMM